MWPASYLNAGVELLKPGSVSETIGATLTLVDQVKLRVENVNPGFFDSNRAVDEREDIGRGMVKVDFPVSHAHFAPVPQELELREKFRRFPGSIESLQMQDGRGVFGRRRRLRRAPVAIAATFRPQSTDELVESFRIGNVLVDEQAKRGRVLDDAFLTLSKRIDVPSKVAQRVECVESESYEGRYCQEKDEKKSRMAQIPRSTFGSRIPDG